MKRRFQLTPEAECDLLAIWEFIARDSFDAADRMADRLERAFRLLAEFPRKGHQRADVKVSEPLLFWPAGSYIVIYRPAPRPVLIVRILHGARDLDALL